VAMRSVRPAVVALPVVDLPLAALGPLRGHRHRRLSLHHLSPFRGRCSAQASNCRRSPAQPEPPLRLVVEPLAAALPALVPEEAALPVAVGLPVAARVAAVGLPVAARVAAVGLPVVVQAEAVLPVVVTLPPASGPRVAALLPVGRTSHNLRLRPGCPRRRHKGQAQRVPSGKRWPQPPPRWRIRLLLW
jgi:hypothetical protein